MRIAIIGAGAVGAYVGGYLARDGHDLSEIEADMEASCASRSEEFRPSMAQDVSKGRRTEIDFINGVVVARGKELGIESPANAGLVEAVRPIERGKAEPSVDLLRGI